MASSTLTPGLRRAIVESPIAEPYVVAHGAPMTLAAKVEAGTKATGGRRGQSPTNPSGATPMMV